MYSTHNRDISIGRDKWISWIDPDLNSSPVNIDKHLVPTVPVWRVLEINCVAACCGIEAFSFWPEDIQNARRELNDPDVREKLRLLRADLSEINGQTFISQHHNFLFDRNVFLQLVDHLIANF